MKSGLGGWNGWHEPPIAPIRLASVQAFLQFAQSVVVSGRHPPNACRTPEDEPQKTQRAHGNSRSFRPLCSLWFILSVDAKRPPWPLRPAADQSVLSQSGDESPHSTRVGSFADMTGFRILLHFTSEPPHAPRQAAATPHHPTTSNLQNTSPTTHTLTPINTPTQQS